jgi:hypothetical protein
MVRELGDGTPGPDSGPQEYSGDLGVEPETGGPITDAPESADETGDEASGEKQDDSRSEPIRDFETDGEEAAPQDGDETGPPAGITWGEESYESPEKLIEAVDQKLKSFEGRIRATNEQLANEKAINNKWEDWYEHQNAVAGTPAKEEPAAEKAEGKGFYDKVDWERLAAVTDQYGVQAGFRYLATQMQTELGELKSGYESRLNEVNAPIQDMTAQNEARSYAQDLWKTQLSLIDPNTGELAYPELREQDATFDADVAKETTSYWGQLYRQYPEFAMSADGIHAAVTHGRSTVAGRPKATEAPETTNPSPQDATRTQAAKVAAGKVTRDASGRFVKGNNAQNEASADMTRAAPGMEDAHKTGPANSMSEAAQRKRIKNAGRVRNSFLAVEE